jgi:hypothetical protein
MTDNLGILSFIFLLVLLTCSVFGVQANSDALNVDQDSVSINTRPLMVKSSHGKLLQVIAIDVKHKSSYSEVIKAYYQGEVALNDSLYKGRNHFELRVPAVEHARDVNIRLSIGNALPINKTIFLKPVHKRTIYLISHSHNDIGYSNLQTVVEQEQNRYIREAMALIGRTKSYPKGAQFKWNIESLWALENFFHVASDREKKALIQDIKDGYIGLSAGYCNELTGVCRPQELFHLLDYSRWLHRKYGIVSKTYIISDVPGMNWSAVPVFSKRGVHYISDGPNYSTRIGYARERWGDKPFYWVSYSKKDTILFWEAGKGYSYFLIKGRVGKNTKKLLADYMQELDMENYPYSMVQLRYTITSDNGGPDPNLPDFVKNWNKTYASPKLVIATIDEMMERFEKKYGAELPVYSGDFTPYWEDGVMSTAREETTVKRSVERLIQAQTLQKLLTPSKSDSILFYKAWRDAVMWHEHTWGAYSSISKPDSSFTIAQWLYKQHFALAADSLSRKIMSQWIHRGKVSTEHSYTVYNTSGWLRNNLVYLTPEQSTAGDGIVDKEGRYYPSQRLSNGDLVFLAKSVPALGKKIFYNVSKTSSFKSNLKIDDHSLENEFLKVIINPVTGSIQHVIDKENGRDLVDQSKHLGINDYLYVPGTDPDSFQQTNHIQIHIKENGPLIISLKIISKAPGTYKLCQDISLISGLNKVTITDRINKKEVRTKESVHFAYPVNVPNGKMRIGLGKGVMRPGINQLPGANNDFACVQRWIDISNDTYGLTIATEETPLIEIGELINEVEKQKRPNDMNTWKRRASFSNTFYFYVMNNYWMTNYKADQEGWVTFHYSLFPHDGDFNKRFSMKKGIESCQPLLVTPTKSS